MAAHEHLGWCAHCPDVTLMAEVCAWRLHAAGYLGTDYEWALRLAAEAS